MLGRGFSLDFCRIMDVSLDAFSLTSFDRVCLGDVPTSFPGDPSALRFRGANISSAALLYPPSLLFKLDACRRNSKPPRKQVAPDLSLLECVLSPRALLDLFETSKKNLLL